MRVRCPFCGERNVAEFNYHGAAHARPESDKLDPLSQFYEYVYVRANPAGPQEELWYHAFGCRSWLRVRRDTRSHDILTVELARTDADAPATSAERT